MKVLSTIVCLSVLALLTACGDASLRYGVGYTYSSGGGAQGRHTGQSAQEVTVELGLLPSSVTPTTQVAIGATGQGQQVGDIVRGEGVLQAETRPDDADEDEPATGSGAEAPPML